MDGPFDGPSGAPRRASGATGRIRPEGTIGGDERRRRAFRPGPGGSRGASCGARHADGRAPGPRTRPRRPRAAPHPERSVTRVGAPPPGEWQQSGEIRARVRAIG
ncbi:hypothetical protein FEF34_25395 [Streptomyces marianii]|uniref:Uncharacterized protein n=1 Tax=Streptomyces marianii TaxID=1817406 RepID=A0A5R9E7Q8_9ACTN|nr:hypothetical protein FEF34_25395 [Streptomyces marianii]